MASLLADGIGELVDATDGRLGQTYVSQGSGEAVLRSGYSVAIFATEEEVDGDGVLWRRHERCRGRSRPPMTGAEAFAGLEPS